jgi:hypothetical protein
MVYDANGRRKQWRTSGKLSLQQVNGKVVVVVVKEAIDEVASMWKEAVVT